MNVFNNNNFISTPSNYYILLKIDRATNKKPNAILENPHKHVYLKTLLTTNLNYSS